VLTANWFVVVKTRVCWFVWQSAAEKPTLGYLSLARLTSDNTFKTEFQLNRAKYKY